MIIYNSENMETDGMSVPAERNERILVCISPSPSNRKVVLAAAKMAEAFHAALTAIYIRPTDYEDLSESDKSRLQSNIRFAEQNGASVTTIVGNDVPVQIAEYAHISGTTKIVIGRSGVSRRHFWSKPSLTEQIIVSVPDVDVYIIPDSITDLKLQREKNHLAGQIRLTWKDTVIAALILAAALGTGLLFNLFGFSEANIITVFILGVLIISVTTVSPIYSVAASLASVLLFNWFFIEPKFSFHTYETEYLVTFGIMLISSLITGSLANRLKENARQSAREAFRTKVLFDTNQMLQKSENAAEAMSIAAGQLIILLDRDVIVYPREKSGSLGQGMVFSATRSDGDGGHANESERECAEWTFQNRQSAGYHLEHYGKVAFQYHPISINGFCYGVVSVRMDGKPLETFEYSVLMSILGECALTLEGLRNAEEKEQASMIARSEQLRANLLRSISHDIRTPLTSISGNASNLLSHYEMMDRETLLQTFSDIYDDSEWLIDLAENLLSISRIENGQIDLHLSTDVVSDVIEEALKHVDRNAERHRVTVQNAEELLLARMDARLIMQVLINLINNAIKNTPDGSEIRIRSGRERDAVTISVSDNGPGIPDGIKPHVFEMFYTGPGTIADGRRGLGLGLALCKSIVEAHGGRITLSDNLPSGCCFEITLPVEEVNIDE